MNSNSSYNIGLSFKVNESMLKNLIQFSEMENQSYSGIIRAGLSLLFAKRFRNNTRNTDIEEPYSPWT